MRLEVKAYNVQVVLMESPVNLPDFSSDRISNRLLHTGSGYRRQFKQTMNIVCQDAQSDCSPLRVARNVHRVLETKYPKMRYASLGTLQKIWLMLKSFVPHTWMERMLGTHYQLGLLEQKPKVFHVYEN